LAQSEKRNKLLIADDDLFIIGVMPELVKIILNE
jgi:hypothetical protein